MRLLADRLVELEVVDDRLRRDGAPGAQKNELKPWLKEQWCIPPKANAEFVCAMEDVLEVYHRPYDPKRPLVCWTRRASNGRRDACDRCRRQPGRPSGSTTSTSATARPTVHDLRAAAGLAEVEVTERRTANGLRRGGARLVEVRYPEAEKIVLVMDNLNTHKLASLYEAFPPAEAKRRIAERLEIHHTPKHGSWLNMAEIELSVLSRQCLDRRVPDRLTLQREVAAWQQRRNAAATPVEWRLTTQNARIKLKRLYPSFQE